MPFVLDTSIAACWVLSDECHATADLALERIRTDEAWVPSLWWFEICNVMITNERRRRLTEPETATFLRLVTRLRFIVDRSPNEAAVLGLARKHRLSVYDASYLELAQRQIFPLATLDQDLARAAAEEAIPLLA